MKTILASAVAAIATVAAAFALSTNFVTGAGQIAVAIDGQPFSIFYTGASYPKPFLAPLRSADGRVVTRGFPMENVAGESRDHPHHRGLWIGYGNVSGVNFWENEFDYTTSNRGRMVTRETHTSGAGTIEGVFEWQDPQQRVMLEEHRVMKFAGSTDLRIIDFDVELTAKQDVMFEDTKEGFFAIRVADSIAEKNGGVILNSRGDRTEKKVWGKRADWVEYSGTVNGETVGITILNQRTNFNSPARWHVRAYGLFAANPFGVKDFDPGSTEAGGKHLAAGQSLRFRYRVIIHRGDRPMSEIGTWYAQYEQQNP
ncbi:MAG: PmoA family protein [Acidobacteriaceae bacterium]|nr:PmoA family protein [Acidobacteriaceae bacterium]